MTRLITGPTLIITDDPDIEPYELLAIKSCAIDYNFDSIKPSNDQVITVNNKENNINLLKFIIFGKDRMSSKFNVWSINKELKRIDTDVVNCDYTHMTNFIKLIKNKELLNHNKCCILRLLCLLRINEILDKHLGAFVNHARDFNGSEGLTDWYSYYFSNNSVKVSDVVLLLNQILELLNNEKDLDHETRIQLNLLYNYIKTNLLTQFDVLHNALDWAEYLNLNLAHDDITTLLDNHISFL